MKLSISNKEIWQITYPIIFGNLAQTIMVLINTIFLGHVGTVELGAVMMAGTFYLVFTTITNGFAVGVQIMVARRFGEEQPTKIGELFEHGLAFALFLGLFLLFILKTFTSSLFSHIIESPNIYTSALKFMNFRQWGIIFVSVNYLFRALYIGLSNTKIITITTLLMASVNIFFDYTLIFGHFGFPKMGVAGAGLSSVLAEITAFVTFIAYTFLRLPYKQYHLFNFQKFKTKLFTSILKISLPTMLQRLLSFGSWFLFFTLIEHLGEEAMAVSGIGRSVFLLCTLTVFAYSATANTVTSRLIGAQKADEVPATLRRILKMSVLTLLPILILFSIFPMQIASIYTDDAVIAAQSVPVLYNIYISALIMTAAMVYFEFVSGTGNTLFALFMESGVLVFYVLYILLATVIYQFPIQWVWCSEWVYSSFILLGSLIFMKRYPWKQTKT